MSDVGREIEQFFTEFRQEVKRHLEDLGQMAVDANVMEGDYHNVTGNLRRSNYYRATEDGLEIGNSAGYASEVASRGYNVIDSGVKLVMEELG